MVTRGAYFVTVCTAARRELFGRVVDGRIRLNPLGQIVAEEVERIATLRTTVYLEAFVVMPNHVHALFVLASEGTVALGAVVSQFKAAVTRRARDVVWQRGYYERIVRDDRDLEATLEYIAANPARWAEDRENVRQRRQ